MKADDKHLFLRFINAVLIGNEYIVYEIFKIFHKMYLTHT